MSDIQDIDDILEFARFAGRAYGTSAIAVGTSGDAFLAVKNALTGTIEIAIKGTDCDIQHLLNLLGPGSSVLAEFLGPSLSIFKKVDVVLHLGIANKIVKRVRELFPEGSNFHVCGHSRGGLLAIYVAIQLIKDNKNVEGVISYGSPPFTYSVSSEDTVTSSLLAKINSVYRRVEHDLDPVPIASWFVSRSRDTKLLQGELKTINNRVTGDNNDSIEVSSFVYHKIQQAYIDGLILEKYDMDVVGKLDGVDVSSVKGAFSGLLKSFQKYTKDD